MLDAASTLAPYVGFTEEEVKDFVRNTIETLKKVRDADNFTVYNQSGCQYADAGKIPVVAGPETGPMKLYH